MTTQWTVTVDGFSHVGRVRSRNEDAWSVGADLYRDDPEVRRIRRPLEPAVTVWVADGLGGHSHGDVASAEALGHLADQPATTEGEVAQALRGANDRLIRMAAEDPSLGDMGTTACGMVASPSGVVVANVGDSPAYQFDDGELVELSVADRGPLGGILQCLGGGGTDDVAPHVTTLPLQPSTVLLCTDGLSDLVSPAQIHAVLAEDPSSAVERLVAMALDAGGVDNVTVVLVQVAPL